MELYISTIKSKEQSILENLIGKANALGYYYYQSEGNQAMALHFGVKAIVIGNNWTLPQKIILFSHELGHVQDSLRNEFSPEEKTWMLLDHDNYRKTLLSYMRELCAWYYAEKTLEELNFLPKRKVEFEETKNFSLQSYKVWLNENEQQFIETAVA